MGFYSIIPQHSVDGLGALDIFYVNFNDVNFYVEDEGQENLYEEILRRRFPTLRISRIFPLNGKQNVLLHAGQNIARTGGPRSVYLLDKDFDDLLGKRVVRDDIFYLDYYCIENYLFDVSAVVRVVIETYPKLQDHDVRGNLALLDWRAEVNAQLIPLFACFFCVQKNNLDIKNCDCKPEEYCHPKRLWEVVVDKVEKYILEMSLADKAVGLDMAAQLEQCRNQLLPVDPDGFISGKFVIAMLFHYVKHKYSLGSITLDSFVFRLAKNSKLKDMAPVLDRIEGYLSKA